MARMTEWRPWHGEGDIGRHREIQVRLQCNVKETYFQELDELMVFISVFSGIPGSGGVGMGSIICPCMAIYQYIEN